MSAELPGDGRDAAARSADGPVPVESAGPGGWPGSQGSGWQAAGSQASGRTGPIGRAPAVTAGLHGGWRPRSRRPVVLAGVAVVALLAGASAALAVSGSRSAAPVVQSGAAAAANGPGSRQSVHRIRARPGAGRFGLGRFGGSGGLGIAGHLIGALHGEFVVAKPGGGYQTVLIQIGKVTAVSSTSITLRSADGYTRSYVVTSSTMIDAQRAGIGSVRTGNQARLLATVSGGRAMAAAVQDLTLLRGSRQLSGFPG